MQNFRCGNANLQIVGGSRIITGLFRCDRTDLKHQLREKREKKTKRKSHLKKKQAREPRKTSGTMGVNPVNENSLSDQRESLLIAKESNGKAWKDRAS